MGNQGCELSEEIQTLSKSLGALDTNVVLEWNRHLRKWQLRHSSLQVEAADHVVAALIRLIQESGAGDRTSIQSALERADPNGGLVIREGDTVVVEKAGEMTSGLMAPRNSRIFDFESGDLTRPFFAVASR